MGLLNLIFGYKKKIKDDFFGEFESQRLKKEVPNKMYNWYTNHMMPMAKEYTFIVLEGNYHGPNTYQLDEIKQIIQNFPNLFELIDMEVQKSNNKLHKEERLIVNNWTKQYYFAAAFPLNEGKPHFEICVEPINEEDEKLKLINFEYVNGIIKDFNCK